ncbi:hypothetical protein [Pseudoalteromonas luteoviolacea]|uniref:Uncharacterized protein n=1 Tax=Pseudoalteromonas luteoviolacea DSM 6061 TaxID=1365250 RepID=A0A166XA78_9GAMM|nr:hypothetical protein [Pseudoalteromonas luteoviolacea]KZN39857.1 hypothetical protein N475_13955 [Pseudoalteromonas luteoviolacea DSM 6061]MBE0385797.1 hypothetical protein [Pseudoalteromonas luteoviolacea DSM 6061]TQF70725.1 hypothetical protein FLM44_06455 [Pseudoalteromonas luteoviolacea]
MYSEPWSDIEDYNSEHEAALLTEMITELPVGHNLYGKSFKILAKREDSDDVLVVFDSKFYIVHLTWSRKKEILPYPETKSYGSLEVLQEQLAKDSLYF